MLLAQVFRLPWRCSKLHLVKQKAHDDVIETRHEVAAFSVQVSRRHCAGGHLQAGVMQL